MGRWLLIGAAMLGVTILAVGLTTLMILAFVMIGPRRQDEELRERAREYYRL